MDERLRSYLTTDPKLAERLMQVRQFSRRVKSSEYHITNACNIRCKGCWFFTYDFDTLTKEVRDVGAWRDFVKDQVTRKRVSSALLIGGEPTLYLERIRIFVEEMKFVTISTNGLKPMPREGFENVAVACTLFGGGALDDELRGIKPSGQRFTGLFEQTLRNYKDDPRVGFVYALTEPGIGAIDETVARIRDNGNRVTFNYYSAYDKDDPLASDSSGRLLEEALRVREKYPDAVMCPAYYIRTLLTGETDFGKFGYDVCPSISGDHPAHAERRKNGNHVLPGFNAYAADLKTVNFCCTSGHCEGCRDSQAVYSWLLVSFDKFLESKERMETWLDLSERYWAQFIWSPFYRAPRSSASCAPA